MSQTKGVVSQVRVWPLSHPDASAERRADTFGAPGWVGRQPEDDWMMQLYELYVRPIPLSVSPEDSALNQYRAGERLQYMARFSTEKNYGIRSTWVPEVAVGWWCPRKHNCDWCNCTLWPCTCGILGSNITPPAKIPKGKARWSCVGGPDLLQQLMVAVAEGCSCLRGRKPIAACAADRLDFNCFRGYHLSFEDRCQARIAMDTRFRRLGMFKEEFEYEMVTRHKRSVSTQTYMEPDGKTLWQGYGVRRLGLGTLWSARQRDILFRHGFLRPYGRNYEPRADKKGPCSCPPKVPPLARLRMYDLRGCQFSLHELRSHDDAGPKKGVLHQVLQLLNWDGLVKPSKLFNKVKNMHSKPPDRSQPIIRIKDRNP